MLSQPNLGESLWGDDPAQFEAKIEAISSLDLRQKAIDFYTKGYCVISGALSSEVCDRAFSAYEDWCESQAELSDVVKHEKRPRVVNLHSSVDAIKDLFVSSPEALAVQDMLFGYKSSVYTSLTFLYGTEQPLHRDTPVFRTAPEEFYFGVWCALEDADEKNGCLQVVSGGHKGCRVDGYEFAEEMYDDVSRIPPGGAGIWAPYQSAVMNLCAKAGLSVDIITAKKGDIVIWHPQLPHGGIKVLEENRTRASVVFHVVPEGTPVYQADVFFNRAKTNVTNISSKQYSEYGNRLFMKTPIPSFGSN